MDDTSLLRLMSWLSPAFPVGAFAYSQGLEAACQSDKVASGDDLNDWLHTALTYGFLKTDAVVLVATMNEEQPIAQINDLALALAGSAQRYDELTNLGASFIKAAAPWRPQEAVRFPTSFTAPLAYPVAVGVVAHENNIEIETILRAFLHAAISNQLQAAQRLMPLGQSKAVAMLAAFEPIIIQRSAELAVATLDQLGTSAISMDIAAMAHETLNSKLFRS